MQQTMIVSSVVGPSNIAREDVVCVATPLDAIQRLEDRQIGTVVLVGEYATDRGLANFLDELYPSIRIEREVGNVATR